MTTIECQVDELRMLFNTKNIFDETSRGSLTDNEVLDIIEIIKQNKTDGIYEVNDELTVELKEGKVNIKDNE